MVVYDEGLCNLEKISTVHRQQVLIFDYCILNNEKVYSKVSGFKNLETTFEIVTDSKTCFTGIPIVRYKNEENGTGFLSTQKIILKSLVLEFHAKITGTI